MTIKLASCYKLFFLWLLSVAALLIIIDYYDSKGDLDLSLAYQHENPVIKRGYKYILFWQPFGRSHQSYELEKYWQEGDEYVCKKSKCVFTINSRTLPKHSQYHSIIFFCDQLEKLRQFPNERQPLQRYIFACFSNPQIYPACNKKFDGFFNFTWTFKLDADKVWEDFIVKDIEARAKVGPKKHIGWDEMLGEVDEATMPHVNAKYRAVLFIDYDCNRRSPRRILADEIDRALHAYNLSVNIMSVCEPFSCFANKHCSETLMYDYFFYLAFERIYYDGYVTDELLSALLNDAVPIVFGGADYTAYMPDSAYINANEELPSQIAKLISTAIADRKVYLQYFRWKNRYSYHKRSKQLSDNPLCSFCKTLQRHDKKLDSKKKKRNKIYYNFVEEWNPIGVCKDTEERSFLFIAVTIVLLILPVMVIVYYIVRKRWPKDYTKPIKYYKP